MNDQRTWPHFLCPNCRAVADLEADVDDPFDFEEADEEAEHSSDSNGTEKARKDTGEKASNGEHVEAEATQLANGVVVHQDPDQNTVEHQEKLEAAVDTSLADDGQSAEDKDPSNGLLSRRNISYNCTLPRGIKPTPPMPIANRTTPSPDGSMTAQNGDDTQSPERSTSLRATTPTAGETLNTEGPMTPRNDAGPFIFDGSAGRSSGRRAVASLVEAATGIPETDVET